MAAGVTNLLLPLLLLLEFTFYVYGDSKIGVTYVDFGLRDRGPGPGRVVPFLLRSFPGLSRVRLPDPSPDTVSAFSYSGISLLLSVPNSLIRSFAVNRSSALWWLSHHVVPFYPRARVAMISVGDNVVPASMDLAELLLPAISNLHRALREFGFRKISVSTTFGFDIIKDPFPPSTAHFDETTAKSLVSPLLDFLSASNSSFLINLYPYHFFRSAADLPIGYVLFQENQPYTYREDPVTGLRYRNLFDMMIDAVITAMGALGRDRIPIVVTETGWPSEGGVNEPEANELFAGIYTNGLIRHLRSDLGTPLRKEGAAATYIFELFDEETKQGPSRNRHWGILYPNMTRKYRIDFSGSERIGHGDLMLLVFGFFSVIIMNLQREVFEVNPLAPISDIPMAKVKRKQLRAIAEKGGRLAKTSASNTDEGQDENDWVIVKKQRIRIWIPPISTEKTLLQSSILKHKKGKPRQVPTESCLKSMARRQQKLSQSAQKKTAHVSKNKEKSSKPLGPAPSLFPEYRHLPQPTFEIASKESNPFVGESVAGPSCKPMVRMHKSSKTHVSPIKLSTGILGWGRPSTQRLSLLAASCYYESKKPCAFETLSCLNLGELQNQQTRAFNLERKLELAGGLSRWLVSQGLEQFVLIFQRENVDKLQLLNLTMGTLKDMGATAVGPRRKLIHAIDRLSQPYYF
ncbi:hypothetical protein H6P81_006169 [Aristolochia fimbriata]|uniref:SAM domain-containing protein n=1 Tax=Aristolochia fimbriata TaxID=158543 RepID=A0AAV7EYR1_ARIFI|nr:hypothetical protein H6P81_006169 [Aristolochia fimbriata]